ncbi:MAG: nicotinamide-nucleotide amidohydrolase family protein [Anaerolineae bacterium]|nr:nicotinamide-nucleotide amidohydrolase family protein [Thermoflexales bacterium]MDW8408638.1 nicotinamide-nucleotide amidohydrolase family protein [Anaerolineae bacterium]
MTLHAGRGTLARAMLVRKLKPDGVERARYTAELIERKHDHVLVVAEWTRPPVDLGFGVLEPGDRFIETFYTNRWHTVFEIRSANGSLKGWYADLSRPARITEDLIEWEDLALDAWMSPQGELIWIDQEEFAALEPMLPPGEALAVRSTLAPLREELLRRWRAYMNEQIGAALTQRAWTLGTAESCTGGLIADELTNRPGSSAYFIGGIVAYDNRIKRTHLGVSDQTMVQYGAVSEQCALEMAVGVRRALGVDVAVSATGIAGPGGGSESKPVGLVYLAVSTPTIDVVEQHIWAYDRTGNKRASADAALRLLLRCLGG